MFRPLEAIFTLHKIDLEEKEYNMYSKRNGVSMLIDTYWYTVAFTIYIVFLLFQIYFV